MMLDVATISIFQDHFRALILDNEVTAGEFVITPALPWARLVQENGIFRMAGGYPTVLTASQAKFEMRNWDEVSLPSIREALSALDSFDYVIFGNNAGQGLPLAQSLGRSIIPERAAIIYAESLPERRIYEQLGYRNFFRRRETVAKLLNLSAAAERPLALCFINTIQHNSLNYHDP
jgi:hypothetical protein